MHGGFVIGKYSQVNPPQVQPLEPVFNCQPGGFDADPLAPEFRVADQNSECRRAMNPADGTELHVTNVLIGFCIRDGENHLVP